MGGFFLLDKVVKLVSGAAELLKAEAVRLHCTTAIFFLIICAKFVLLNAKQEKQALFNDFSTS